MIVDAHTHLSVPVEGYGNTNVYGLASEDLDSYLRAFDENGVDACFVFPLVCFRDSEVMHEENTALADACRKHPDRLFPWGTVNPAWPEKRLRAEINYCIGDLGMHGLKLVPVCQGSSLSCVGVDIIADEAVRLDVPVTTHDGSPEYCSAVQVVYLARQHPDLRVLSAHSGLRELWPDFVGTVGELPNLYLCLSGPTQWGIQVLYDNLGPEKLLFGSDGGLGHKAVTTAYLRRIARLRAPREHKAMILGGNAMQFVRR